MRSQIEENHSNRPSVVRQVWVRFQALDPRIPVLGILFTYLVLGLTVLGFNRSPLQALATTALCCGLDFLLAGIFYRFWAFPLSALITSFSLSFLLSYSHSSWMIVLPPLLAIGSSMSSAGRGGIFSILLCSPSLARFFFQTS